MEEETERRLAEKVDFFKELHIYDYDCLPTESENDDEATAFLISYGRSQSPKLTPNPGTDVGSRHHHGISRTLAAALPTLESPSIQNANLLGITVDAHSKTVAGTSDIKLISSADPIDDRRKIKPRGSSKAMTKRKRGKSVEMKPESEQIFKGKLFYLIPNDDISPARAFRIRKAREWGAVWVKEWRDDTSHIIVDDDIPYEDVLRHLHLQTLPTSIAVVNVAYVPDCIIYRYLVNPKQSQYRIPGNEEIRVASQSSAVSPSTPLPLKSFKVVSPQSPSRTEGSDEVAAARQIDLLAKQRETEVASALERRKSAMGQMDALDEAIEEARETKGLPLDSEEDEPELSRAASDDAYSSDEEQAKKKAKVGKMKAPSDASWQDNFSCMHNHGGPTMISNPNARTIEVLQEAAAYYERTHDQWRVLAYRKAIAALRKHRTKITTKAAALAIPSIGARLAAKIEEIVWTNGLRRLDHAASDPVDKALQLFLGIYGVGATQAAAWLAHGYRTLEDLERPAVAATLTRTQQIGLARYADFQQRMPRAEVEKHVRVVRAALARVDPALQLIVGGSYRRGAPDSGDVDFLIWSATHAHPALRTLVFETLITRLLASTYLRAGLATASPSRGGAGTKWQGAACLPGSSPAIWRRVDFLIVPAEELGAALIYFTGNDVFNRSIRLLARKKGMRLNQRGLWKDVWRGGGGGGGGAGRGGRTGTGAGNGTLVEGRSEKRIFEILGVPWRRPEERVC